MAGNVVRANGGGVKWFISQRVIVVITEISRPLLKCIIRSTNN